MDLLLRVGHSITLLFHSSSVTLNGLLVCLFRDLFLKDLKKQRETEKTEAQFKITALENEVHSVLFQIIIYYHFSNKP